VLMEPVERMIFFQGVDLFERGCVRCQYQCILSCVFRGGRITFFSCKVDRVEGGFAIPYPSLHEFGDLCVDEDIEVCAAEWRREERCGQAASCPMANGRLCPAYPKQNMR
jgi:hypothetical protein